MRRLDPNPDVDELLRYQGYRMARPPVTLTSLPAPLPARLEGPTKLLYWVSLVLLVAAISAGAFVVVAVMAR